MKNQPLVFQRMAIGLLFSGAALLLAVAAIWRGRLGLEWAIAALVICILAALPTIVIGRLIHGQQAALWAMLLGMGIRMAVALVSCILVKSFWHNGIEAGFAWYLVAAYLITLSADTLFMAVPNQQQSGDSSRQRKLPGGPSGTGFIEGELHG